jgi:hypothetical protein
MINVAAMTEIWTAGTTTCSESRNGTFSWILSTNETARPLKNSNEVVKKL